MKKSFIIAIGTLCLAFTACKSKVVECVEKSEMQQKFESYAYFDLNSDVVANLTDNEKKIIPIFIQIGEIMDNLFWKQTFGDKSILDTIQDSFAKEYAMINYGPWDRLNEEKPFIAGYGEKPAMCNYYPQDITK